MAANTSSRRMVASLGKRFGGLVWTPSPRIPRPPPPAAALFRSVHTSVYDKNIDELVAPSAVPDEILLPKSDKYWAPNPKTGVFGPASEHSPTDGSERGSDISPPGMDGGYESVLEQKAFFRPLENLEKPQHP
ncbi:hypothetical protein Droror1_Dr00022626 [Drosera rotundifolia]